MINEMKGAMSGLNDMEVKAAGEGGWWWRLGEPTSMIGRLACDTNQRREGDE